MATVKILSIEDLPDWVDTNFLSDNGCGMDYAEYLFIHDGDYDRIYSDAMEPEDARFHRDLGWVQKELVRAYAELDKCRAELASARAKNAANKTK